MHQGSDLSPFLLQLWYMLLCNLEEGCVDGLGLMSETTELLNNYFRRKKDAFERMGS